MLVPHDFDPQKDVAPSAGGGLRWSSDKPELHAAVARYHSDRRDAVIEEDHDFWIEVLNLDDESGRHIPLAGRREIVSLTEALRAHPLDAEAPSDTLERLVASWSGSSSSTALELLEALWRTCVARRPEHILEAGTGVSTLVLGALAERLEFAVTSLEHVSWKYDHIRTWLDVLGLAQPEVLRAPLERFEDSSRHATDQFRERPIDFLVVNGPMGERYESLPRIAAHVGENALCIPREPNSRRP